MEAQRGIATELAVPMVAVTGLVWLSLQHKTVPYVVEVDSLGAALAIKPVASGGQLVDEQILG